MFYKPKLTKQFNWIIHSLDNIKEMNSVELKEVIVLVVRKLIRSIQPEFGIKNVFWFAKIKLTKIFVKYD